MPLHFQHEADAALQLAFSLLPLDPDAIVKYLETVGDLIVADHANLGISRAEALELARGFCTATLDRVIQMRGDQQVMH